MAAGFDSLDLSPSLLAVVKELGYEQMTPVQAEAIPVLLAGKDLIGQSKTGSGKTAAFAIPILHNVDIKNRVMQALVLCPTRELCAQVAREFRKLGRKHAGFQVLVVSGGLPMRPQTMALERGVHVVVGTPGRLLDHMRRSSLDLSRVAMAVLDEADRMLDMGFAEEMNQILGALPEFRQTVFFSATFPGTIEAMSRTHQREAVRVTIDDGGEEIPEIHQLVLVTEHRNKLRALYRALAEFPHESALIFCNLKVTVAELTATLSEAGVSVDCLHGDMEQFDRDRVMAMFRNESVRVLVATDVAARGIDVIDLELVVNYDLPSQPEIYIHRIGRTGRAGNRGVAVSIATSRDARRLDDIERRIGAPLEQMENDRGDARGEPVLAKHLDRAPKMDTIRLASGRKDKLRPGDIQGALMGEAGGLSHDQVGKIEVHDRHAYVAVAHEVCHRAIDAINNGRIKGRKIRASQVKRFRPPAEPRREY